MIETWSDAFLLMRPPRLFTYVRATQVGWLPLSSFTGTGEHAVVLGKALIDMQQKPQNGVIQKFVGVVVMLCILTAFSPTVREFMVAFLLGGPHAWLALIVILFIVAAFLDGWQ